MEGWKEEEEWREGERERREKTGRGVRRKEEEKEGWREEVGGSGFRSYMTFTTCMPSYCTPWLGKSEEEV